jgi:hypothetical protein
MVRGNLTEGISFNNVLGEVTYSDLSSNGFTGLSVTDADVNITNSHLSGNGRFEVDNNGSASVVARKNDWGTGTTPDPARIYDSLDEEGIGTVITGEPQTFSLAFPGTGVPSEPYSGNLLIVGDVPTPRGKPVTLKQGARVWFSPVEPDSLFDLCSDHPSFPSSELIVGDRFFVNGTADNPVIFTGLEQRAEDRSSWGAVNLVGSNGTVIRSAVFQGAATGLHAREAKKVRITQTLFHDNEVGLRFSRSDMVVEGNVFRSNGAGLRFHDFGGLITKNRFHGNDTAIFVTDNPKNVTIRDNSFSHSEEYNIKLGIHVTEDVTVEGGVLEVPGDKDIGDLIFDKKDDGDLGRVIILP